MKKAVKNTIIACCIATTIILISDFFNLPSRLGIDTTTINWDIVSIVVSNIVVIGLYLITYHVLDKRSVAKETNQRKTAEFMMTVTYDRCIQMVGLVDKAYEAERIAEKCGVKRENQTEDFTARFLRVPFDHNEAISEFAKQGVITCDEYRLYLQIQKYYRDHINIKVLCYGDPQYENFQKAELIAAINEAKRGLSEKNEVKCAKNTHRKFGRLKRNR